MVATIDILMLKMMVIDYRLLFIDDIGEVFEFCVTQYTLCFGQYSFVSELHSITYFGGLYGATFVSAKGTRLNAHFKH